MKQKTFISKVILLLFILFVWRKELPAQQYNCNFKEPLLTIDFSAGENEKNINELSLPKYRQDFSTCPNDGYYSFVSNTSNCFNDDWLTLNEDHTLNDADGKMMLVNANETGGVFFNVTINGLKENTTYQLAAWLVNVCKIRGGCAPLPPNINMILIAPDGKKVASFQTGLLSQNPTVQWKGYSANFTTPQDITTLILTMEDKTHGGCGNDFAMDDVTVRECVMSTPNVATDVNPLPKPEEKKTSDVSKPAEKPVTNITKPPEKKIIIAKPSPVKKDSGAIVIEKKVMDTPEIALPKIKDKLPAFPVPQPILTRETPLIRRIETAAGEIIIDLYDNGQIDGDTVSIYHNNELIVSGAALSDKPISFRIKVDNMHPHHELVMVADNLGSIPPNTSLMIITANNKRYEVFISSSEQKNAKIAIDLKE